MIEKIPDSIIRLFVRLGNRWFWFGKKLNSSAINSIVNSCRHRPHPWSTVHDYISWTSLTDQRFSARHLPAKRILVERISEFPTPESLEAMFTQPLGEQKLCIKSTCLFPAFAQYVTDGFIRTKKGLNASDVGRQNTSNHQLDMCPLYGRLPEQTDVLRLKRKTKGEKGRLRSQILNNEEYAPFLFDGEQIKPEFANLDPPVGLKEILALNPDPASLRQMIFAYGGDRTNASPQVSMINTLFLREHNRLAGKIEDAHPDWDDERVFQTSRNSLIVLFIKIVVEEYINHISPSVQFRADPEVAWDAPWNKPNWVTTEFSLLYRWHSLVPNTIVWNGQPIPLMLTILNNGPLLNAGLASAFADMSSQAAGLLGAFNTPDPILHLEVDAIKQGRLCDLASYSDYCEYVSMPRPRNFDDISRDPKVVNLLRNAYRSVDDVDFYVGLFAEDTVKNSPLPLLLLRMVGIDAFSQALTNPLLSRHVFNRKTFSEPGWEAIQNTHTLRDILERNSPIAVGNRRISMTRSTWTPS